MFLFTNTVTEAGVIAFHVTGRHQTQRLAANMRTLLLLFFFFKHQSESLASNSESTGLLPTSVKLWQQANLLRLGKIKIKTKQNKQKPQTF